MTDDWLPERCPFIGPACMDPSEDEVWGFHAMAQAIKD
jgi:hypothetical protein